MSKKIILSILLISLGVIIGLLVTFTYSLTGGKPGISLAFLAAAVALIITGSIMLFSQLLDRIVNPVLEEIQKDIEDDIQDLRERRTTGVLWMLMILGISVLVFSFFVFRLHKLEAMWGQIPVAAPTILGVGAVAFFIPRTRWYQNKHRYTPMWIYLIPAAGLIITLFTGIGRTENVSNLSSTRSATEPVIYNSNHSAGTDVVFDFGGMLDFDVGDDEAGFVILLVVLIFILVVGSAVIPHFWLFSGSIMLGLMATIAIHDLRIRRSTGNRSDSPIKIPHK
jgi:Na+(H+)/acetate symporter ActP